MIVPKAFLPPGDSSVVFGVFIAPRRLVAGADAAHPGPSRRSAPAEPQRHRRLIEVTGLSQFLASNQGIMFTFLKPPERARADSAKKPAKLMGSHRRRFPA